MYSSLNLHPQRAARRVARVPRARRLVEAARLAPPRRARRGDSRDRTRRCGRTAAPRCRRRSRRPAHRARGAARRPRRRPRTSARTCARNAGSRTTGSETRAAATAATPACRARSAPGTSGSASTQSGMPKLVSSALTCGPGRSTTDEPRGARRVEESREIVLAASTRRARLRARGRATARRSRRS